MNTFLTKLRLYKFLQNIRSLSNRLDRVYETTEYLAKQETSQVFQRQLFMHYQLLHDQKLKLPKFEDTGFRVYSQNDEDGLLLYIFALIGFTNKICVDIAFGSPYQANVTNLICNWGFSGLLVEGKDVKGSQTFFKKHPDTALYPPKIIQSWVTVKNINKILTDNDIKGEIDLLSLDVDGVDYWLWKNLKAINPRVVVIEYLNFFDAHTSVTIPYSPNFIRSESQPDYFGASLAAFTKLGKSKGYRLIGCNKYNFNAFFIRKDIAPDLLPEVSVDQCLRHPCAVQGNQIRYPQVKNLDWENV